MDEAIKTYTLWPKWIRDIVNNGAGIDIGCGACPISNSARPFDIAQGDANNILDFVSTSPGFDFVFSSHCLEHLHDPEKSISDWWQLVRPGGALIVIVPDEDLYEQGFFPSIFNFDHKHTFTIGKSASWSPVSHNVFDMASTLPGGNIKRLRAQDHGYDKSKVIWGSLDTPDQTRNEFVMAQIECIVIKQSAEVL